MHDNYHNRLVNCEVATMGNRAETTHQLKEENRFRFRAPLNHKNHHQLLQPPYDILISANPSDDGAGQRGIMHHHKTWHFPSHPATLTLAVQHQVGPSKRMVCVSRGPLIKNWASATTRPPTTRPHLSRLFVQRDAHQI